MDRDMILQSLTALDFMAVDLGLYLNTHPNNKEAIEDVRIQTLFLRHRSS